MIVAFEGDNTLNAWVASAIRTLFESNDGRYMIKLQFTANKSSFRYVNVNGALRQRPIKDFDVSILILTC